MNKKQIETIAKQYVTFTIETNLYKSPPLNSDKIGFVFDGVMVIKEEKDVFIQTTLHPEPCVDTQHARYTLHTI